MKKLIVIMLLSCLWGCSQSEDVERSRTLFCQYVGKADKRVETFSGVAVSTSEIDLSFRVRGTIVELPIKVGMRLKKGDVIARLDTRDYQHEVERKNQAVTHARALFQKAKSHFHRLQSLYEIECSSLSKLESARANFLCSRVHFLLSQQELSYAEASLLDTCLIAPSEGMIVKKVVEIGENVAVGKVVARMQSEASFEVTIFVAEKWLQEMVPGKKAEVIFTAFPSICYLAEITKVGISESPGSAFPVTFQLFEKVPHLCSGMSAEVVFRVENQEETLVIPGESVVEREGRRWVFVLKPLDETAQRGIVHKVPVRVHELVNEGLVVTGGLKKGDLIVTRGFQTLREGNTVNFVVE